MDPSRILKVAFLNDEEKRSLITYRGVSSDCFLSPLALLSPPERRKRPKEPPRWLERLGAETAAVQVAEFLLHVVLYLVVAISAATPARLAVVSWVSPLVALSWACGRVLARLLVPASPAPLDAFVTLCARLAAVSRNTLCGVMLAAACGDSVALALLVSLGTNLGNLGTLLCASEAPGEEQAGPGRGPRAVCRRAVVLVRGNASNDAESALLLAALAVVLLCGAGGDGRAARVAPWAACLALLCLHAVGAVALAARRHRGLALARTLFQATAAQAVLALGYGLAARAVEARYARGQGSPRVAASLLRAALFSAQFSLLVRRELKGVTFLEPWRWRSFPDLLWFCLALGPLVYLGLHPIMVAGAAAAHMTTLALTFSLKCLAEVLDHMRLSIWSYDSSVRRLER